MSTGILTTPDAPSVLKVMGNLIGTNAAGTSAIPNAVGIVHTGDAVTDDLVRIGGDTEAERNVISGNEDGVLMMSGSTPDRDGSDKVIAGNYIGVAADGETALGNTYSGISGCGELKMTIRRNVIAHNGESGVNLCITPTPAPYGVVVSENVIYQNTGLAIDLEDDGRTANDADDSDTGSNDLQNFPVLTSVQELVQGGVMVTGQLTSAPSRSYRVELFTTGAAGFPGQNARAFVAGFDVTTNASGVAAFSHPVVTDLAANEQIAATATDVTSMMTSELSDSSAAFVPLPRFGVSGTITLNGAPLSGVEVTLTGDRKAVATTGADGRYAFASLPMGGGYTVTPAADRVSVRAAEHDDCQPSRGHHRGLRGFPRDVHALSERRRDRSVLGDVDRAAQWKRNGDDGGCRVPAAGWPARIDHGAAHGTGSCGDRSRDGAGARRQRGVLYGDHGAGAARREPHDALGRRGGAGRACRAGARASRARSGISARA